MAEEELMPSETFVEDGETALDQEPKFLATLVRGEVHFLRDIRFDKGSQVVIYGYQKDHLEEHAVERVGDDDGELMVKDKFTFKPYAGEAEVGTVLAGAVRDEARDYDAEARLRAFSARDKARTAAKTVADAPKFDKVGARKAVESRNGTVDDGLPKPRPRIRRG